MSYPQTQVPVPISQDFIPSNKYLNECIPLTTVIDDEDYESSGS